MTTTAAITVAVATLRTGTAHVHTYNCADLQRNADYRRAEIETIEVMNTREAIVGEWFYDLMQEAGADWREYASEIKIFPCVKLAAS